MGTGFTILSTKLLDERYTAAAEAAGIVVEQKPFIKTQPLANPVLQDQIIGTAKENATVVFTSANAVNAVADVLKGEQPAWLIYCISGVTADAVRNRFPESNIIATADHGTALAREVIKHTNTPATFFCGNLHLPVIPSALRSAGLSVTEVIVYETLLTPHTVNKNYDGILFFSPSAVKSFFGVNTIDGNIQLFAIGETTADALKQYPNPVHISDAPTQESMIKKITEHFNQINA